MLEVSQDDTAAFSLFNLANLRIFLDRFQAEEKSTREALENVEEMKKVFEAQQALFEAQQALKDTKEAKRHDEATQDYELVKTLVSDAEADIKTDLISQYFHTKNKNLEGGKIRVDKELIVANETKLIQWAVTHGFWDFLLLNMKAVKTLSPEVIDHLNIADLDSRVVFWAEKPVAILDKNLEKFL